MKVIQLIEISKEDVLNGYKNGEYSLEILCEYIENITKGYNHLANYINNNFEREKSNGIVGTKSRQTKIS